LAFEAGAGLLFKFLTGAGNTGLPGAGAGVDAAF